MGKLSFTPEQLMENFAAVFGAVLRARPSTVRGVYMQRVVLTSTMGPGYNLDVNVSSMAR
jgi:large subunit ribosomal protein L1